MRKVLLQTIIIAFAVLACQHSYAMREWAKGEILGSRSISDIDLYSETNFRALDTTLANYRKGCEITYSSATTLIVGDGEVTCSDSAGTTRRFRKNTSNTSTTFSDIESGGNEAGSTTYYVYANADTAATTFTVTISASSSAPNGVTYYKRLGSFYNDGSSNILNDESLTNDDDYYALQMGDWVSKSNDTSYLATTDGFATGYNNDSSGNYFHGYTDAANPPTTVRVKGGSNGDTGNFPGIMMPVKKGDYYKVTGTGGTPVIFWIPLS